MRYSDIRIGDIVCNNDFDANFEYEVYYGDHNDGDLIWSSVLQGRLNADDVVAMYTISYLTIDFNAKRFIIETL